eukprot:373079_1
MNRRQTYASMGMKNNQRNHNNKNSHVGRHSMAMGAARGNALRNNMNMGNLRRTSLMMNSMKISKDPRPLKDKKWQEEQIEKMIEYLCCHGYDSSMLSPNDLSPPSTKNFQYICCFLFQQIDPSFNLLNTNNNSNNNNKKNKKFEEEVIAFFDKLGYPFKISKSSIRCIAPHAWPSLLGAIAWLLELLLFAESFDEDESDNDDEDSDIKMTNAENDDTQIGKQESEKMERLFFNMVAENYGSWLKGEEDDAIITQRLMDRWTEKVDSLNGDIASFETANEQLITETKRLEDECPKISKLQHKRQNMIHALNEIKKVGEQRTQYIDTMRTKLREWENKVNEKIVRIKISDDKITELRTTLSAQTISTKEVQRMHQESISLHTQTDELELQKEEIARKKYVLNENIADEIKKANNLIKTYNDLAQKIEIIPKGAKYSFGQNHTLKLKDLSDGGLVINKCTDLCNQDIDHFANNLSQLRNHFNDKINKAQTVIKAEQDKVAQIESDIQLKQFEVDRLEERMANVVSLYNNEKSKMTMMTAETAQNIEKIELSINEESYHVDQELKDKQKEFEKVSNEYNKRYEEYKKIEIQITSKVGIGIKKLLKHRQNIRETLKRVNKKLDEALEKTSFYHIQEPTIHNINVNANRRSDDDDDNKENQDIVMQNDN